MADSAINLWRTPAHALEYLGRADSVPHRTEGEAELLECLPDHVSRVLDLGSGAGRLLGLVKLARPGAEAVALDFSETMLRELRENVSEWQQIADALDDERRSRPTPTAN
jgi:SAM-dependent methyltransferase